MEEPILKLERSLAALADAVETYATDQRPATFDAMERALNDAKRVLCGMT